MCFVCWPVSLLAALTAVKGALAARAPQCGALLAAITAAHLVDLETEIQEGGSVPLLSFVSYIDCRRLLRTMLPGYVFTGQ